MGHGGTGKERGDGIMAIRSINIRIEGEQAAQLRTLWAAMKERHLPEPGKRLNRALRDELMNIALRWEDEICDSDILVRKAVDGE